MLTEIAINSLRGIDHLRIDDLRRINLFVGRNNAGKSTVLEAIFLLGGATNPVFPTTVGQLRGQRVGGTWPDAVWRPLFSSMDPRQPIEIRARRQGEAGERRLRIEALNVSSYADAVDPSTAGVGSGVAAVTQEFVIGGLRLLYHSAAGADSVTEARFDPKTGNIDAPSRQRDDFFRTTYLSARAYGLARDTQQFSYLVRTKQEQDVLDGLRLIEPRTQRIEVLTEPGGPAVYVDLGLDSLVPLAVCGEGFVRLFSLIVELTASRGGVLLIDEIDNGLHYSVMRQVWRLLHGLSVKHDVQVFATTHNEELVGDALEEFGRLDEPIGLFRIDRTPQGHRAVAYDRETQEAVLSQGFEVRG